MSAAAKVCNYTFRYVAPTNPNARGLGLAAELTNFALDKMKQGGTVLRHHKDQVTGEYVDDLIFHKILED